MVQAAGVKEPPLCALFDSVERVFQALANSLGPRGNAEECGAGGIFRQAPFVYLYEWTFNVFDATTLTYSFDVISAKKETHTQETIFASSLLSADELEKLLAYLWYCLCPGV